MANQQSLHFEDFIPENMDLLANAERPEQFDAKLGRQKPQVCGSFKFSLDQAPVQLAMASGAIFVFQIQLIGDGLCFRVQCFPYECIKLPAEIISRIERAKFGFCYSFEPVVAHER
jgi:hypothetical protein